MTKKFKRKMNEENTLYGCQNYWLIRKITIDCLLWMHYWYNSIYIDMNLKYVILYILIPNINYLIIVYFKKISFNFYFLIGIHVKVLNTIYYAYIKLNYNTYWSTLCFHNFWKINAISFSLLMSVVLINLPAWLV